MEEQGILLEDLNKVIGLDLESEEAGTIRDLYARKARYMLNQYTRESNRKQDAAAMLAILKSAIEQIKEKLEDVKSYTPNIIGRLQEDLTGQERRELESLFIEWARLQRCIDIMDNENSTAYIFKP